MLFPDGIGHLPRRIFAVVAVGNATTTIIKYAKKDVGAHDFLIRAEYPLATDKFASVVIDVLEDIDIKMTVVCRCNVTTQSRSV